MGYYNKTMDEYGKIQLFQQMFALHSSNTISICAKNNCNCIIYLFHSVKII